MATGLVPAMFMISRMVAVASKLGNSVIGGSSYCLWQALNARSVTSKQKAEKFIKFDFIRLLIVEVFEVILDGPTLSS